MLGSSVCLATASGVPLKLHCRSESTNKTILLELQRSPKGRPKGVDEDK